MKPVKNPLDDLFVAAQQASASTVVEKDEKHHAPICEELP
jgi:hypothetical protein